MAERVDVAVVGLGAMGSAVLHQLAKRGCAAVGIDRFRPPHDLGSSHGETRITRQAVGEGAAYVPFVSASHRIWRELETATGQRLFESCGALIMGPGTRPSSHHGKPDFARRSMAVAREFAIEHECLDAASLAARFPFLAGLTDEVGYFEPGGGYLYPERCIGAQLARAETLGARTMPDTEVLAIEPDASGVTIRTQAGTVRADRAVVAAGAWTAPLLGDPFPRLLTVRRQVLHWFALEKGAPITSTDPVFIWMHGTGDGDYFYGFPPLEGDGRLKVATEQYRVPTSADAIVREVEARESEAMFDVHLSGRIGGVSRHAVKAAACAYTVTPDQGFIIDRHPDSERVTVVSACSGHGFKHSAGIGECVAELLSTGHATADLAPFALARFRLH